MEFNSIQDFKSNFSKIYHGKVKDKLNEFEKEKNVTKFWVNLLWVITILISGFCCWTLYKMGEVGGIAIGIIVPLALSFTIVKWLSKRFEKKLKERVMPDLMQAFGNFTWTKQQVVDTYTIRRTTLYERFEWKEDDDNFFGSYKGIDINIDECKLKYETRDKNNNRHEHTEFEGVIVQLTLPRHFKAHTIIRQRILMLNKKVYEEIKLEDPEFMKMYFVDGSDQVESRYLLTTAFMERFKNVKRAFGAKGLEASFNGNELIMAIRTDKDLFSLGNIYRPLADTKQFTTLLEEFISILAIVDELKLNQNIGL